LGLTLAAQAPDNSKTNQRDRDRTQPTADQQKGNRTDLEITRDIRRSITKDKHLSTYAKNIKIITQNGNVTLRGPVRSEEDKKAVEAKANEIAGVSHVKSEIEIARKKLH
jgi:hyperosmotically inducible protein